jgi:hypothetical protein
MDGDMPDSLAHSRTPSPLHPRLASRRRTARWGTDQIRVEVQPDGEWTLLDTFDKLAKAARDAAGWHVCLDALEAQLDGARPSWDTGTHWKDVHPRYVAHFAPKAAALGPPAESPVARG